MNKNLSKKILMFSELIGGVFLALVGVQAIFASTTINTILVFTGVLFFLSGLGHSDELDREKRLQKPGMGPTPNPGPGTNHPRDVHPNILCGSGDDNSEEQKED